MIRFNSLRNYFGRGQGVVEPRKPPLYTAPGSTDPRNSKARVVRIDSERLWVQSLVLRLASNSELPTVISAIAARSFARIDLRDCGDGGRGWTATFVALESRLIFRENGEPYTDTYTRERSVTRAMIERVRGGLPRIKRPSLSLNHLVSPRDYALVRLARQH